MLRRIAHVSIVRYLCNSLTHAAWRRFFIYESTHTKNYCDLRNQMWATKGATFPPKVSSRFPGPFPSILRYNSNAAKDTPKIRRKKTNHFLFFVEIVRSISFDLFLNKFANDLLEFNFICFCIFVFRCLWLKCECECVLVCSCGWCCLPCALFAHECCSSITILHLFSLFYYFRFIIKSFVQIYIMRIIYYN